MVSERGSVLLQIVMCDHMFIRSTFWKSTQKGSVAGGECFRGLQPIFRLWIYFQLPSPLRYDWLVCFLQFLLHSSVHIGLATLEKSSRAGAPGPLPRWRTGQGYGVGSFFSAK